MATAQEFKSGSIGWEVLFIFIAGALGDMVVHFLGHATKGTKYPFAQGLNQYYKSLGDKFLIFNTNKNLGPIGKKVSSWFQGAIWGGIACVIALLIAKLFLYTKEEQHQKNI